MLISAAILLTLHAHTHAYIRLLLGLDGRRTLIINNQHRRCRRRRHRYHHHHHHHHHLRLTSVDVRNMITMEVKAEQNNITDMMR